MKRLQEDRKKWKPHYTVKIWNKNSERIKVSWENVKISTKPTETLEKSEKKTNMNIKVMEVKN